LNWGSRNIVRMVNGIDLLVRNMDIESQMKYADAFQYMANICTSNIGKDMRGVNHNLCLATDTCDYFLSSENENKIQVGKELDNSLGSVIDNLNLEVNCK